MADTDLADHFEDVLDREEGKPEPQRREKSEPEEGIDREDLFPQRAIEGEPSEADEPQDIDEEDEDADDRPPKPDDEEEDEQAELDLNQVVRVTVDGQPAEVSLQEALNGYVRAETFHRRLNQLQQVANQINQERADLTQKRDYYSGLIPLLQDQLASLQPQEPDWDKLYDENPVEAAKLERQWRMYREKLGQMHFEHQKVREEQARERERQEAISEDTERRKLVSWVPEWTDGKRWDRDRKSMIRTALAYGFSEQELNGLRDARQTLVLSDATKWRAMMAAKPKPVKQQGSLRPGAISSRAAPNGQARAERRLQRTGSVRDAARAFEVDLDREG
jgi:chromosome segregation ATPase